MSEIIKLIPFKVKPQPLAKVDLPSDWYLVHQVDWALNMDIDRGMWAETEKIILGKIWTVVGSRDYLFLLVRPGEIAQWYPQRFCKVVRG